MAELYGASLDALLGRRPNSQRDLRYLLGALEDAVFTSRAELQRTTKTLRDRLDDIPSDFEGYDTLARLRRDLFVHLDAASTVLAELIEQFIADTEQRVIQQFAKQLKNTPPAAKGPQK